MGHRDEWSVPSRRVLTISDDPYDTLLGADTCQSRGVLLRVWMPDRDLEMEPDRAVELAERLLEKAREVLVRRIMES